MMRKSGEAPAVITAKWTTKFHSVPEYLGTIMLDDRFQIRFPMLHSFSDIPFGTNVLWGDADDLRLCTAVTLPFGPPGSTSAQTGRQIFHARSFVRYLLVGHCHIADPDGPFVGSIAFTPQPNQDLHKRQFEQHIEPYKDILEVTFSPSCQADRKLFATAHLATFAPELGDLFEAAIREAAMTVTAWIGADNCVRFCLKFDGPRRLEIALDDVLAFCAFLSFIAHQHVYATDFSVLAATDGPYELHCRAFSASAKQPGTWVRNTLVLPDDEHFGDVLQRWYATNAKALASRYLYRYSLEKPHTYSPERFLAVFRALEGIIDVSGHQFLTPEELDVASAALRQALSTNPKLDAVIRKFRSGNTGSPSRVLKAELPRIFNATNITVRFNIDEFVDRVYRRRNQLSHGGPHLDNDPAGGLINDTLVLTATYLVVESRQLGLDANDALRKFRGNFSWFDIPFNI